MTSYTLQYCPIVVDDVDSAVTFYRDALGLEVRGDVGSDGHRWVTVGFPDLAAPEIVLSDAGAGRPEEDAEVLRRLLAKGLFGPYVLVTTDLQAAFDRVVEADAEVIQEPKDQPWGPRDFALRDPAGNIIRVNQAS